MLGRHVQRVEAVPLVLDFRSFDDGKTHAREDLFHAIADDGERVAMPEQRRAAWERDVNRVAGRRVRARRCDVRGPARLDRLLQIVGEAADGFLLVRRRARDLLHPRRDDAVLAAEKPIAQRLGVAWRSGLRQPRLKPGDERCD